uniref:Putative secreted protein n=1 Tax=Anopheles marajoara TaxID=58244 RepID=A0A2M4CF70_9DIPT
MIRFLCFLFPFFLPFFQVNFPLQVLDLISESLSVYTRSPLPPPNRPVCQVFVARGTGVVHGSSTGTDV